ncbi:MAG: glycosyltransferase family 1 protein [Planctomycetota bacterium]|nr:MAG: glycosyltransferase family 1 protein [Planctomycetota bacterium]
MRVLFYTEVWDPKVGSSTRQMYQEATRLRELGHAVAVVGCTQDPSEARPTKVDGTLVFRIHSDYPVRFRAWVSLHNKRVTAPIEAVIAEWRPDVVHAHLIHTHIGYHALTQARRAGAGVVFTAHDVMVFCYQKLTCFHGGEAHGGTLRDYEARLSKCVPCQRFRFRPGRNAAIRKILERDVHRFTVVSDELGEVIRANGIRVDRTVYNAIRPQAALPDAGAVAAFRERFGLRGKRVLAIGGRLHEQKGVSKLLAMLAHLRSEFPDLRLLVMGRREIYEGSFAAEARALGVADAVVSTDWLSGEELQCAYAATDVFVTPSICFDTFGLVNLEAMEHKKPVVATEFGGSPEVVADGVSGFIANPFDVPAYAEKIAQLLRDEGLRRTMGAAGHARMLERFTIERLTDEYLEEYERAIELAR